MPKYDIFRIIFYTPTETRW